MADDVFVLNQGLEMRGGGTGKQRVVVRVVSEPLVINTDPEFLAMAPTKRLAAYLKQQVLAITAQAAPATLKYRQAALAAFVRGKPWAMARYSGGRTGSKPPLRSDRAFNDSERFAEGITATQSKDGTDSWRVNVPANRLSDDTSGGFEHIWNKLVSLVPAFGDPLKSGAIEEGIKWSLQNMTKKMNASSSKMGLEVAKRVFELIRTAVETADSLAG